MTAGPTPNKVLIAVAVAVWLVHGIATGEASALDVVLAMAVVAALLWPEPVPGREDKRRSSKGHPSAEAARISAHRDAAQQLARHRPVR